MQSQVSTFKDLEEAEYFVAETIKAKELEIIKWLEKPMKTEGFEFKFPHSTGKFLQEGQF